MADELMACLDVHHAGSNHMVKIEYDLLLKMCRRLVSLTVYVKRDHDRIAALEKGADGAE